MHLYGIEDVKFAFVWYIYIALLPFCHYLLSHLCRYSSSRRNFFLKASKKRKYFIAVCLLTSKCGKFTILD